MDLTNAKEINTYSLEKKGDFIVDPIPMNFYGQNYIFPKDAEGFYLFIDTTETGSITLYSGNTVFAGGDKDFQIPSAGKYCFYFDVAPYMENRDGKKMVCFSADLNAYCYAILK